MSKLYLGVDQGTQSSRALLFDEQGNEVASAHESVEIFRKGDGYVEQDADQLITSVKNVINNVLSSEHDAADVVCCGIATQRSTVLGWNSEGVSCGPVLSWQDVRNAGQLELLRQYESEIRSISGLPLSAHYGASKIRWLLDNVSNDIARTSPLISYLLFHLLVNKPYMVDHSNAQRTQLMSLEKLDWSRRLSGWFGVPFEYLPECTPMCADYGRLAHFNIPVTAVCGDQNAAIFGSGEIANDTALVNMGSGAFVLRLLPERLTSDTQLTGIAYSDKESTRYVREGTVNGAGSALNWLGKNYNIEGIKENMNGWLGAVSMPPLFINTIGELGSPWWRQDIEAEFIDADMSDQRALVVAVIESILFMVRANLELMTKETPLKRIRVSGGLSNSDGLCQRLSNLCALPVERIKNPETTARGVAWLAAGRPENWSDGRVDNFKPVNDVALQGRYKQYMQILNKKLGGHNDT